MSQKAKILVSVPQEIRETLRREAAEKNLKNLDRTPETSASLAAELLLEKMRDKGMVGDERDMERRTEEDTK